MTRPPDPDDEPLTRPFLLDAGAGAPVAAPSAASAAVAGDEQDVRPYVVTSGRTPTGPAVALEALVRATARGRTAQAAYEAAQLLVLCREPQSVAEMSAHLRLPVGVVRVLVADLAAAGLLTITAPPGRPDLAHDPAFLERLMLGVTAL
jgi:Protein of unknown function (DUF742)